MTDSMAADIDAQLSKLTRLIEEFEAGFKNIDQDNTTTEDLEYQLKVRSM